MGKVILFISMSVDGFVTGPDVSRENLLGKNGELLHRWLFDDKTEADDKFMKDAVATIGAVILGNRTYTTAIVDAWESKNPFESPAVVVCHKTPAVVAEGFTYIHEGIEAALQKAKTIAGEKNIWIMGGADIAQQYLSAGLLDEVHLTIAPAILGGGTRLFTNSPLFKLELKSSIATKAAMHLVYQIV